MYHHVSINRLHDWYKNCFVTCNDDLRGFTLTLKYIPGLSNHIILFNLQQEESDTKLETNTHRILCIL